MTNQINYQVASLEEIAARFEAISNQAYCHVFRYYTDKQDTTMLSKLQQARALSRIRKLQAEYLEKYGVAA